MFFQFKKYDLIITANIKIILTFIKRNNNESITDFVAYISQTEV